MTRAEWDQFQHDTAIVESLLGPIEADVRARVNPATLYHRKPGADLTRDEATLLLIAQLRRALTLSATNPRKAAHLGLLVGLRTGDRVRKQILSDQQSATSRKKGKASGATRAENARDQQAQVARLARRWSASDELQDEYRTLAAFLLAEMPEISRPTIYRRIQALKK